jgi:hypothetical protein
MIPKLSGACYAFRSMLRISNINTFKSIYCAHFHSMLRISNINTFKSIYCAYFHSIIKYELTVWGNSSNSEKIFTYKRKSSELWLENNPELHVEF